MVTFPHFGRRMFDTVEVVGVRYSMSILSVSLSGVIKMASKSSEFGGVPGRIAPLPHPLTAAEQSRLERAIDPMDLEGSVEAQRVKDSGRRGVGPVDRAGDL